METMQARMTDDEIRATVERMKMNPKAKATLLSQALAGRPEARFAVYARYVQFRNEEK